MTLHVIFFQSKLLLRPMESALGWLYIQFEQSKSIFLVHYITTRGHLFPQACSVMFDKLLQR